MESKVLQDGVQISADTFERTRDMDIKERYHDDRY
jgi:F0F1-type ATP synthase epsilon subunit